MLAKNQLQNKLAAPEAVRTADKYFWTGTSKASTSSLPPFPSRLTLAPVSNNPVSCLVRTRTAANGLGSRDKLRLTAATASRRQFRRCEIAPWPFAPCETPHASRLTGALRRSCSWSLDTAASSPHKLFFSAELLSGRILSALGSPSRPFSAQSGHLGDTVSGFPHR
ncbi:uncharacterized protein LOC121467267 [Drosophila elegans]|uniref:uncharacterized protein LOC121467267 n=1 Tax=Drosophila elegans TaxID=30023 RepID=UPI001BC843D6|nr:uncharacterized protein LOC121467267 [Drosophila elegans]